MKTSKTKILFILPSLKAGGAERVISFVSQNLDKTKFECVLVVLGHQKDAIYEVDNIDVHFLNRPRLLKSLKPLFNTIKKQKPDIVLGSIGHVNSMLTLFKIYFRNIIFVGREASLSGVISKFIEPQGFKYYNLYRNYFKNLDHIICQSKEMAENLIDRFKVSEHKISVINNPISSNLPLRTNPINSSETKELITIGRLSLEKGHKRILEILTKLETPFRYTIIGDGDQKDNIMKLAKELNLSDNIRYIKYTDNVSKYLSDSDLFLQGSFVEGFPNALLESCVIGTPIIAFRAPGGTQDIVEHNVNGYLAENGDDYFNYINKALSQQWKPEDIRNSVIKKFNSNAIIKRYETAFKNLMTNKSSN